MSDVSEFTEICISNVTAEDLIRLVAKVNNEGQVYILLKLKE